MTEASVGWSSELEPQAEIKSEPRLHQSEGRLPFWLTWSLEGGASRSEEGQLWEGANTTAWAGLNLHSIPDLMVLLFQRRRLCGIVHALGIST